MRLLLSLCSLIFYNLLVTVCLSNEWIEDTWVIDHQETNYTIASVNGKVTHGDRLRVRFTKNNCSVGNLFTTVYTMADNPNLAEVSEQFTSATFMDQEIVAKILFVMPFMNGHTMWIDLGWVPKEELIEILLEDDEIFLKFKDDKDFKATEYMDIAENYWKTNNLRAALEEASDLCERL